MFKFGFELEGFFLDTNGVVAIPPKHYSVDGFPGLCEVRTYAGEEITKAYFNLVRAYSEYLFSTSITEHSFSALDRQLLRKRPSQKSTYQISNIYGKSPKLLGNRTLASLQINISKEIAPERYIDRKDGTRECIPAKYALFDFLPIIKALDIAFANEIQAAHRQIGFYSVKDNIRLEYRSLPNSIFTTDVTKIAALLNKIITAVNVSEV